MAEKPRSAAGAPTDEPRGAGEMIAGRYVVEQELGRGGMATVYLASDRKHDRDVALKFFHAAVSDAVGAERFLGEIALLAKLQHPHILPLYDSGEADGSLYYVMPYVDGESLRDRLDREHLLPVDDALRITGEVAEGLAFAHGRGIVHRDIKPENILLSSRHAMVADFGIARAVHQAARAQRITDHGFAIGTPRYMSPEQASGDPLDGRSDEYSLACVLYEMLAGEPPHAGGGERAVLAQRFTTPARPIRQLRRNVPEHVERALDRALAPVPADRFPTVDEFAAALQHADRATPRRGRRRRLAVVGASLAAVAAAAAAILLRPAQLDGDVYVVFPFEHDSSALNAGLTGDNCEKLLYDEFGRWKGVRLVNDMAAHEALRRLDAHPRTLASLVAAARSLHAGRMVWGQVFSLGGATQVRATLYDVNRQGAPVRQVSLPIVGGDATDLGRRFAELADSLALPLASRGRAVPSAASEGVGGTHSIAALRAYLTGHEALREWQLDSASADFRAAIGFDPGYAHAYLWLAQVMSWRSEDPPSDWRSLAERAAALGDRLGARDRRLAEGLFALADGDFPRACEAYGRLVQRDSLDFTAWFGLGECHARDHLVVRDPAAIGGWRFRSSYHSGVVAYLRALDIAPSFQGAFTGAAFSRLPTLLFTEPNIFRRGVALSPDTMQFAAFPGLDADTLSFVPRPWADVLAGRVGTRPATAALAVQRDREQLRAMMERWTTVAPRSGSAHETLALVLESQGTIDSVGARGPTALSEISLAQRMASTDSARLRYAVHHARLLIKLYRFGDARRLADSIVASRPSPSPSDAAEMVGPALLGGHIGRAAALAAMASATLPFYTAEGDSLALPSPLSEAGLSMLVYASAGGPADSIVQLERRVETLAQSFVSPARRAAARYALLDVPALEAFPELGARAVHRPHAGGNVQLEMQWALAQGDSARVRARFDSLAAYRRIERPGDIHIDVTYQEAWLHLAMNDTTQAIAMLDLSLDALSTLSLSLLDEPPQTGALVRAMMLRADLAAARGDASMAAQWARAVVELWDGADPSAQHRVARMRKLAMGAPPPAREP